MILRAIIIIFILFSCPIMADEFNFEDLTNLISNKKITKIEDLIEALPDSLKKYFTLMKKSGSLHEASYDKPRAILYGETGKLIVTFNSDSSQKGGDFVEIMELKEGESPQMREIAFDPKGIKKPQISNANPEKCLVCHGNPPKPIWGNYFEKNGAYGANVDGDDLSSNEEKEQFAEFRKVAKHHPRYSKLYLPDDQPLYPFVTKAKNVFDGGPNILLTSLLLNNHVQMLTKKIEKDPYIFTFLYSSQCGFDNDEKDILFMDQLTLLIKRKVKLQNPLFYSAEEYFRENNPEDELPAKNEDIFVHKNQALINQKILREAFGVGADSLNINFQKDSDSPFNESGLFRTSKIMLLNSLMYSLRNKNKKLLAEIELASNFDSSHALYRFGFRDEIALKTYGPMISHLSKSHSFTYDTEQENICKILKPLMAEELNRVKIESFEPCNIIQRQPKADLTKIFINDISLLNDKIQRDRTKGFQKLVKEKKCIDCHDKSGIAKIGPNIPFLNDKALAEELKKNKSLYKNFEHRTDPQVTDVARMPLGQPALTKSEREEILEYLNGLMNAPPL